MKKIPQWGLKKTPCRSLNGLDMRGRKERNNRELRGGQMLGRGLCGFQVCARESALVRKLIPHFSTCRLWRCSLLWQSVNSAGGERGKETEGKKERKRESCSGLFLSSWGCKGFVVRRNWQLLEVLNLYSHLESCRFLLVRRPAGWQRTSLDACSQSPELWFNGKRCLATPSRRQVVQANSTCSFLGFRFFYLKRFLKRHKQAMSNA